MGASSGHHFAMRPLAHPPWLDFSMILLLLFGRSWKGPEKLCVCWVLCSKGHRISCLIKACHELLESFPLIPAGFSLSSSYSLALDCPPTVFYWASHSAYTWSYICMNLGCKLQKLILAEMSLWKTFVSPWGCGRARESCLEDLAWQRRLHEDPIASARYSNHYWHHRRGTEKPPLFKTGITGLIGSPESCVQVLALRKTG